jgi:hypothetical protein
LLNPGQGGTLPVMARKRKQWHPAFTQLLSSYVESYYEGRTGVAVGDLPREADLILLRRDGTGPTPFIGLWRLLTTLNVLEFKGPTEAARPGHLPLLVELGLGIARRVGQERRRSRERPLREEEVAFWYLANRLGRRFQTAAQRRLPGWEAVAAGVWRGWAVGHPVYLVSTVDLPVDDDSLALHVLAREPLEQERQVGALVTETPERVEAYASWFAVLHPRVWREVKAMAQKRRPGFKIDLRPVIEELGIDTVIRYIGPREYLDHLGVEEFVANLPAAKRKELERQLAAHRSRP